MKILIVALFLTYFFVSVFCEKTVQFDLLASGDKVPIVYDDDYTIIIPVLLPGNTSTKTIYLELPANVDKIVGISGTGNRAGNCLDYRLRLGAVPMASQAYTTLVGDEFTVYKVNIPFSPCKKYMELKPIASSGGGKCSLFVRFSSYGTCAQMPYVKCYNQIDCNNNVPVTPNASNRTIVSFYTISICLVLLSIVTKLYLN